MRQQRPKHSEQATHARDRHTRPSSSNSLEHRYYVDTQDIVNTLKGASKILQKARFESFHSPNTKPITTTSRSASQPRDTGSLSHSALIAQGDTEATELIRFVERVSQVTVDKFLQLDRLQYRAYQSEDSSLLTSVYFNHNRDMLCGTLTNMAAAIGKFVQDKFSGK